MSRDNSEKKKLSREERKKVAVRVVAMIMAVLMILGLGVTAISILLGSRARAAEPVSVIDCVFLHLRGGFSDRFPGDDGGAGIPGALVPGR